MARLKSSTVSPFDNVPQQGRHVVFDRISKDWHGFYNGHYVGSGSRNEVEEKVNASAYNAARLEGWAAGYRQALQEVAA